MNNEQNHLHSLLRLFYYHGSINSLKQWLRLSIHLTVTVADAGVCFRDPKHHNVKESKQTKG